MSKYYFEELTTNEKYITRLKIATRKYRVFDGYAIVSINLGKAKDVYISEKNKLDFCGEFSVWEPIYKKLENQLQEAKNGYFIEVLKQYKGNGGQLGAQIKNKLFIKYYHLEKPANIERDDVGRKWIDYNAQLSKAECIYDTENGCGIWVTNLNFIYEAMVAVDRYGKNIMILSPINDLEYIIADNEIVGDGFEVKMYGSLSDEDTWDNLWKMAGNKIIEDMPSEVKDRFDGAKKFYDKHVVNKEIIQMDVPEKNYAESQIMDIIKSIINKTKKIIFGMSDK